jgi:TAT (twin-arginine translocation) pathway signal sequence
MGVKVTAQRPKISRRQLFRYGASAGAAATVGPMLPAMTSVAHAGGLPRVLPAPEPIPGGIQIPRRAALIMSSHRGRQT